MIKRERADRLIAAMIEEAEAINQDPRMIHWVERLSVFGSYLTEKPVLGDLDVAYQLKARWNHDLYDYMQESFREAFPPPHYIARNLLGEIFWPETMLLRRLRKGPGISFHDQTEVNLLGCDVREIFSFDNGPATDRGGLVSSPVYPGH